MTVITRVYDDYVAARAAQGRVHALGLPDVEVSVLGNENLRNTYESDMRGDTLTDSDMHGGTSTGTRTDTGTGTGTGAGIGATIGGGAGLLAGLGMLAIPGVGPLVAAGWLAATAVGAAGGALAGGAVGAMVDLGLSEEEGPLFTEAIRRGGIAVSVRCMEHDAAVVEAALDQDGMMPLTDRRATYEADGWTADETDATRSTRLASMAARGGRI